MVQHAITALSRYMNVSNELQRLYDSLVEVQYLLLQQLNWDYDQLTIYIHQIGNIEYSFIYINLIMEISTPNIIVSHLLRWWQCNHITKVTPVHSSGIFTTESYFLEHIFRFPCRLTT